MQAVQQNGNAVLPNPLPPVQARVPHPRWEGLAADQRPNAQGFQANNQGQIGGVRQLRQGQRMPNPHLAIAGGVVAAIRSTYNFSQPALKILRKEFGHLLLDPTDLQRCLLGDKQGFKDHPHALGAFLRAYYDDLICYNYHPNGTILDVGGSVNRTFSRWEEVSIGGQRTRCNQGERVWTMAPCLDGRDVLRKRDHFFSLQDMFIDYNDKMPNCRFAVDNNTIVTINNEPRNCDHREDDAKGLPVEKSLATAQFKTDPDCPCQHSYSAYKSIESWYYHGVAKGIFRRLAEDYEAGKPSVGYFVANDYYRMLANHVQVKGQIRSQVLNTGTPLELTFSGCVGVDGVPESIHIITEDASGTLEVTAHVKGNPAPYCHTFPRTSTRDTFAYGFTHGNVKYLALMQKIKQTDNGEVPLVLYKTTIIPKKMCNSFIHELEVVPFGDSCAFTLWDLIPEDLPEKVEPIKLEDKLGTDLKLFNEDLFKHKEEVRLAGEKRYEPDALKKRVESSVWFLRTVQRQFCDRNTKHHIALQYVKGVPHLVVRKYVRSFFGLVVGFDQRFTAMADLQSVLDAYVAIGVKSNSVSIHQCLVQQQRDAKEKTSEMLGQGDAFIIASILRQFEAKRYGNITA